MIIHQLIKALGVGALLVGGAVALKKISKTNTDSKDDRKIDANVGINSTVKYFDKYSKELDILREHYSDRVVLVDAFSEQSTLMFQLNLSESLPEARKTTKKTARNSKYLIGETIITEVNEQDLREGEISAFGFKLGCSPFVYMKIMK